MEDHIKATLLIGMTWGALQSLKEEARSTNNPLAGKLSELHELITKNIAALYYEDKE